MKSSLSVYHLFKVLNFLGEETLEVSQLFYSPGMKAPKDFRYDVTRGTLVTPDELYEKLESMRVNNVIPHCGRQWVISIERYC